MSIPKKFHVDFEENKLYHVYNRTNNKEKLFRSDANRAFFMNRYKNIVGPFLDTFCWNLLPNHFHFLARVKSELSIKRILLQKDYKKLTKSENRFLNNDLTFSELIERTFKRFYQSYAQSYNSIYDRKGNLFYKPFKRVVVTHDQQFTNTVVYIHANAQKHGLINDFSKHQWSSWSELLSDRPTDLMREELFEWFGSKEKFIRTHYELVEYFLPEEHDIEDDELPTF